MKKTLRLLPLLLAMVMMLALTVTAGAEEVTTTAAKSEITVIYTNDVHPQLRDRLRHEAGLPEGRQAGPAGGCR